MEALRHKAFSDEEFREEVQPTESGWCFIARLLGYLSKIEREARKLRGGIIIDVNDLSCVAEESGKASITGDGWAYRVQLSREKTMTRCAFRHSGKYARHKNIVIKLQVPFDLLIHCITSASAMENIIENGPVTGASLCGPSGRGAVYFRGVETRGVQRVRLQGHAMVDVMMNACRAAWK